MSINKVILVGHLGQDPEVKNYNGNNKATFSLATNESYKDKNGQKVEKTEWHRVVIWGKLADIAGKYLAKGRQVYIEGKLQTRQWEDNGQKKYATEVLASTMQMLGNKGGSDSGAGGGGFNDFGSDPAFDNMDEIPF